MRRYHSIVYLIALSGYVFCQQPRIIEGRISDAITGKPLVGATVSLSPSYGTISDTSGLFRIALPEGKITLTFRCLGYQPEKKILQADERGMLFFEIKMNRSTTLLDEIVVSASKYEQKLSDVMVSMDLIPSERIERTNPMNLQNIIKQTPGVEILNGQPSIRGGSGYSYGAGSRVLVLMDDLPMLSADVGDVKWDYLPVENISSIEIIKGPSSVLYGSSALNGVFNIRSAYPTLKPSTRFSIFSGIYADPKRKEMVWWNQQPVFSGTYFSHTRKIKNLDLVIGGNLYHDPGYRENEYRKRGRMNLGLTHYNQKIKGLTYGINLHGMLTEKSDFILWQDADSGAYRQNTDAVSPLTGNRFHMDPHISYLSKNGSFHSLKTRLFHVKNDFRDDPDKNNSSNLFYGEYKYHKNFTDRIDWTLGLSAAWSGIIAALYGNHNSFKNALYSQVDGNITDQLNLSLGIRFERYCLDNQVEHSTPVFRAGLNYQISPHTFLRASFGQGYRFPSVAEKYTATSVASVNIFPNPDLKSENGWSTEIGIKQGIKAGRWNGYLDLSAFWSEYNDMIEFNFGLYKPDSVPEPTFDHIGFMALNVGNTRIQGLDLSLTGKGEIVHRLGLSAMVGYTFMNPLDLNVTDSLGGTPDRFLKYRYRHSAKADAELTYWKIALGFSIVCNSKMENIDDVFLDPFPGELILPGFPDYWSDHNFGYTVVNTRFIYEILPILDISVLFKNVFNREYMGRPGDIYPPLNMTLKLLLKL